MNDLLKNIELNVIFLVEFLLVIMGIFIIAYMAELYIRKKKPTKEKILSTRKIVVIGMLSAIAVILMMFEVPIPFIAPDFYKIDLSELPILICAFAYGPVAGILAEAVKILLKLVFRGTQTAFVGELANFVIGSILILVASIIYDMKKTKRMAVIACVAGTLSMTIVGTLLNAFYLLPKYAEMYGIPVETFIKMGTAINGNIDGILAFVIICVAPINLVKGVVVSILTIIIYQPLRPIIKNKI